MFLCHARLWAQGFAPGYFSSLPVSTTTSALQFCFFSCKLALPLLACSAGLKAADKEQFVFSVYSFLRENTCKQCPGLPAWVNVMLWGLERAVVYATAVMAWGSLLLPFQGEMVALQGSICRSNVQLRASVLLWIQWDFLQKPPWPNTLTAFS